MIIFYVRYYCYYLLDEEIEVVCLGVRIYILYYIGFEYIMFLYKCDDVFEVFSIISIKYLLFILRSF